LPFTTEEFTRIFTFEFIGTSFLAYGALACEGNPIKLAIFFFLAIVMAGPFSGAHINPAVTLAFYLKRKNGIEKRDAKVYLMGQLLGAFTGGLLGYLILGEVDSPFVPR
jgi:glycerol uptake facilitator-like aquaporin